MDGVGLLVLVLVIVALSLFLVISSVALVFRSCHLSVSFFCYQ